MRHDPTRGPGVENNNSDPVVFYRKEEEAEILDGIKSKVHKELISRIGEKKIELNEKDEEKLKETAVISINDILNEMSGTIPARMNRGKLLKEIMDEILGFGPLEDLLKDPQVTEIMVNSKDKIYVEKSGKLELSHKKFVSDRQIMNVIERIITPIGRRTDESSPMVDARLPDGSRMNAVIPPLSLHGPVITIRKFSKDILGIDQLINSGSIGKKMAQFLELCVLNRCNVVISGGTGSGKTTLLNILSNFISPKERIVTIEDSAELKLCQEHVISLESRPSNIEGKGQVTIRDLVRNSLRMRPDRIVVGEVRGGECLDMLQAMNTGHDGSLTTVHANSPRDVISRLETMVLMAGMELPVRAIREQIASAVDLIVQQSRFSDGSRKITNITEVTGLEGDRITLQDIFVFKQTGFGKDGKVQGDFAATGNIPKFAEDWRAKGIEIPTELFNE